MTLNRRGFLTAVAGAIAAGTFASAATGDAPGASSIKAAAFDAFPIFDPRPVFVLAGELFPGRGAELSALWRARQFEYQWLRALSGRYADFWKTTEDALVFAAKSLNLQMTPELRDRLMGAYLRLEVWPDVPDALRALKDAGLRLALLSNATERILESGIKNSRLDGIFEHVLSTDRIKTYKPDPRAYQLGVDAFGLPAKQIAFVAFAGWDAAGAKWFGYPTFWVDRQGLPAEELDAAPESVGKSLTDFVAFAARRP